GLTVTSGTAGPTSVSGVLTNPSGSAPSSPSSPSSSSVLTNPSGTGSSSVTISTGPGLPSTGGLPTTSPSGNPTTSGSGGNQSQTQNAALSKGGQLFYIHDIVAVLVVWAGIVVGGAMVL
ncbi:hypothetical protein PQX77_001302, partial [Marasmius sp. AFHP31]